MSYQFDQQDVPFLPSEYGNSTIGLVREKPAFLTEKDGKVVSVCGENILIAVQWLYPGSFRFNVWSGRKETNVGKKGVWRPIEDYDYMIVRSAIQKKFTEKAFRSVSLKAAQDAVEQYCYENPIDLVKEYFTGLYKEWDKIPRLDTWLINTYGVDDTSYYRAAGANWIKGMVMRALMPGVKFDYVLVLEGRQGIGKSTSLSVLGGDWHTEITFSPDNKDFFMALQGHLIVEFSEGETLSRSEVKQLKAVISSTKDTYRPPYGRETVDVPRRCVFAMTTNQNEYLKDETGNRRWLPVECRFVDIEWLKNNRDQLFAEALERMEDMGEKFHEFPEEETQKMQGSRVIEDPDAEKVVDWYFTKLSVEQREAGIATEQAFQGIQPVQGLTYNKMTKADQMRIGGIFRSKLFLERKVVYHNGSTAARYYPSAETRAMTPEAIELDPQTKAFLDL